MPSNEGLTTAGLIQMYRNAFREHGDTPSSVMWPRGRQAQRFHALTQHFSREHFSVLDYGCGLAHLKSYLDQRFKGYKYFGVDIVPEFVDAVESKFPDARVQLISSFSDVSTSVDHVVISGTFNIIEEGNRTDYIRLVKSALLHLFRLARVSLAVNFMTDRVDFMQPHALHMNVEEMQDYVRHYLSPRLICDESYMPYEFSLVVLKDCEVIRPDNIFNPA